MGYWNHLSLSLNIKIWAWHALCSTLKCCYSSFWPFTTTWLNKQIWDTICNVKCFGQFCLDVRLSIWKNGGRYSCRVNPKKNRPISHVEKISRRNDFCRILGCFNPCPPPALTPVVLFCRHCSEYFDVKALLQAMSQNNGFGGVTLQLPFGPAF